MCIDFLSDAEFENSLKLLIESLEIPSTRKRIISDIRPEKPKFSIQDSDDVIPNLYDTYASAGIVADPAMFFGREELLTEIINQVCLDPVGKCFVLYGHKRLGKSSILYHLWRRIAEPCLPVSVHLGLLGVDSAESQNHFIRLLLDDLRHSLHDRVQVLAVRWPSESMISERPIDAFKEGLWAAEEILLSRGWREPRIVFLLDDFSYLFEDINKGIVMKQWKVLREFGEFSAVLVGNDLMPMFMSEFPNEFAVTTQEHLRYFTATEMTQLADQPILLNGKTRYRGNALDRLYKLTGGNPYYTQGVHYVIFN